MGQHRAVSGSSDQTLKLWDLESLQVLKSLPGHAGSLHSVFADFEKQIAICGGSDGAVNDCTVVDMQTGKVLKTLSGHSGALKAVAADFKRQLAVSGSDDGTLKLWDLMLDD